MSTITSGGDTQSLNTCPLPHSHPWRPSNNFSPRSHQVKPSLPDIYVQYFKCQIRKILNFVNKFQLMGMKLSACTGTKVKEFHLNKTCEDRTFSYASLFLWITELQVQWHWSLPDWQYCYSFVTKFPPYLWLSLWLGSTGVRLKLN